MAGLSPWRILLPPRHRGTMLRIDGGGAHAALNHLLLAPKKKLSPLCGARLSSQSSRRNEKGSQLELGT